MELGIASVAAITAGTYLIGMAVGIASGWPRPACTKA